MLDSIRNHYTDNTQACTAMLGKWLKHDPGTGEKRRELSNFINVLIESVQDVKRLCSKLKSLTYISNELV